MAKQSRRLYITLDRDTYDRLEELRAREGIRTLPRLASAILKVYLGTLDSGAERWNIPEDEGDWLAGEFARLTEAETERPGYRKAGPFNEYTK